MNYLKNRFIYHSILVFTFLAPSFNAFSFAASKSSSCPMLACVKIVCQHSRLDACSCLISINSASNMKINCLRRMRWRHIPVLWARRECRTYPTLHCTPAQPYWIRTWCSSAVDVFPLTVQKQKMRLGYDPLCFLMNSYNLSEYGF